MEGVRHHDLHVIDAAASRHLQDLLDDPAPDVRGLHGRQGDRDVVDGDRQPHAGLHQLGEGLGVRRVEEGVADGAGEVLDSGQRIRRVDHAGPERELLEPEPLAFVHEDRRRPLVYLQHESRSWHLTPPVG